MRCASGGLREFLMRLRISCSTGWTTRWSRWRAGTVDGVAELLDELDVAYEELLTTLADARQRRWVAS